MASCLGSVGRSRLGGVARSTAFVVLALLAMLGPAAARLPAEAVGRVAVLEQVWELVRDHFYDPNLHGVDWPAALVRHQPAAAQAGSEAELSSAINAMLAELRASHTAHYGPHDVAYYELLDIFAGSLRNDLGRLFARGEVAYTGIGLRTQAVDGRTFVSGLFAGLPAAAAGLRVGDEILAADGAPYDPIRSFAVEGVPVRLSVRRSEGGAIDDIDVTPIRLRPNETFYAAMENSIHVIERGGARIGYVHVWSYAGGSYQRLLEREITVGRLKDADALIWDLRDGWGGAQPDYLDLFSPFGPEVTLLDRNGHVGVGNARWRKPAAMLINAGTRSGKEILAEGFKRYGAGPLIGTRTTGAVLAGRAFLLRDDTLLILAVSDVRVDGKRLEGEGVAPTEEVERPIPFAGGSDPQLERAIERLIEKLRG